MKLNLDIKGASSQEWLDAVLADFDSFLQDHADCERKASAMNMSLVAKYPNRLEIIPELIATGIEELQHFEAVYKIMESRGLQLQHSIADDPYIKGLMKLRYSDVDGRFLDHLLIASVFETRGGERFRMVAEAHSDPEIAKFYKKLWISEAKHGHTFVKMALHYFPEEKVYTRLNWWVGQESIVVKNLPIRAALH
ncbi:MAG: tRNA-(ms[2]io[6]A)-hydroxylase [Arcticibacterium sp.]|jgi:tRNA-(ms[2]io[6]A)-hydroxylase